MPENEQDNEEVWMEWHPEQGLLCSPKMSPLMRKFNGIPSAEDSKDRLVRVFDKYGSQTWSPYSGSV